MADLNRLSGVQFNVSDGNLGRVVAAGVGNCVMIGTSSLTTEVPLRIRGKKDLSQIGNGIARDEAEDMLSVTTPPKFWVYTVSPDVLLDPKAEVEGSTEAGKLPTLEGKSQTAWEARFVITLAGAPNEATFKWFFNNVEKEELTLPTDKKFIIPNTGVTITFKDLYEAGDAFVVSTEGEPTLSPAKLLQAVEEVLTYRLDIEYIAIANTVDKIVLTGLSTMLEKQAVEKNYYIWSLTRRKGILASGGDLNAYVNELSSEIGSFRSKRIACIALEAEVLSNGESKVKVPLGLVAGFISSNPVKNSLNEVKTGRLPNFLNIFPDNLDDSVILDLQKAGYLMFRRYFEAEGVYISNPRLTTDETSDFNRLERTRIMNKACFLLGVTLIKYIGSQQIVDDNGKLANAAIIRADANKTIEQMLRAGEISGYEVIIDESQDVIATGVLEVQVKIRPTAYVDYIVVDLAYTNPNSEVA